jgi:TonB family protein
MRASPASEACLKPVEVHLGSFLLGAGTIGLIWGLSAASEGNREKAIPLTVPRGASEDVAEVASPKEPKEAVQNVPPGGAAQLPTSRPVSEQPLSQKETGRTQDAEPLSTPEPKYPTSARRADHQGSVLCRMQIDDAGAVTRVEVVESSGFKELDDEAQRCLSTWKFSPRYENGHAVVSTKVHRVTFALEGSRTTGRTGATRVGHFTYAVKRARWSKTLSTNEFLNRAPNASFLIIDLEVRNTDREPRTIPGMKLIDENGSEYSPDSGAWMLPDSLGLITELNPEVTKKGAVIFDVPRSHRYRLQVSGGYGLREVEYFNLDL